MKRLSPGLKICSSLLLCSRKKTLNVSATSRFFDKILSSFARVMFSLLTLLFENISFTVFQNILLLVIFEVSFLPIFVIFEVSINSFAFLSLRGWYNNSFACYMQLDFQVFFFSESRS